MKKEVGRIRQDIKEGVWKIREAIWKEDDEN